MTDCGEKLPSFLHAQERNFCKDGINSSLCVAVNWDDGYLAAVRALLKKAVGEPCIAQLHIARSLAQLLKAVPAWMLAFGDANNQGCTAHAGFQSFQVALCSQLHKHASQCHAVRNSL